MSAGTSQLKVHFVRWARWCGATIAGLVLLQVPASAQDKAAFGQTTMAVSLTVTGEKVATPPEGERFVTGKGALSRWCEDSQDCAAAEPNLVAKGAANSGFRVVKKPAKVR